MSASIVAVAGLTDAATVAKKEKRTDKVFARPLRQTSNASSLTVDDHHLRLDSSSSTSELESIVSKKDMATNTSQSLLLPSILTASISTKSIAVNKPDSRASSKRGTFAIMSTATAARETVSRILTTATDNILPPLPQLEHPSKEFILKHSNSAQSLASSPSRDSPSRHGTDNNVISDADAQQMDCTEWSQALPDDISLLTNEDSMSHYEGNHKSKIRIASHAVESSDSRTNEGVSETGLEGANVVSSAVSSSSRTARNDAIRQYFRPNRHKEHSARLYYPGMPASQSPANSSLRSHSPLRYEDDFSVSLDSRARGEGSPRSISPRDRSSSPRRDPEDWSNRKILPQEVTGLTPSEQKALDVIKEVRKSKKKGKKYENRPLTKAEINLLRR